LAVLDEETVIVNGGVKSLAVGATTGNGYSYQNVGVTAGRLYHYIGYSTNDAGNKSQIRLYDLNNGAYVKSQTAADRSAGWTAYEVFLTVPIGCSLIRDYGFSVDSGETAYYDDKSMVPVDDPPTTAVILTNISYDAGFDFNDGSGLTVKIYLSGGLIDVNHGLKIKNIFDISRIFLHDAHAANMIFNNTMLSHLAYDSESGSIYKNGGKKIRLRDGFCPVCRKGKYKLIAPDAVIYEIAKGEPLESGKIEFIDPKAADKYAPDNIKLKEITLEEIH